MVLNLFAALFLFWNTAAWDSREGLRQVAADGPQLSCLASQDFSPEFPALEEPTIQLTPYFQFARNRETFTGSAPAIAARDQAISLRPVVGWQSEAALQSNWLRESQMLFPFHFFL